MITRVIAATVAGGIVFYIVGFVLFAFILDPILKPYMTQFPGLMKEPMPDLIFLPLWNLSMAFLFAVVFEKWAGIRTFVGGLKGGLLLMFLISLIINFDFLAFMNVYKGPVGAIVVIAASTFIGTLAGGAVGAVLGLMNKSTDS
jgi:hypothetical protein